MRISDWSSDVCSSDLATTAFTAKWLVPRVSRFQAMHPDVDLRLHASDDTVDVGASGVDIAIRYGRGPYPGLTSTPLRSEEHTSELQSLMRISYAVFCLKKKTRHNTTV